MATSVEMPLQETMRALAGTPPTEKERIAILSWAAGRWNLLSGKHREAERLLRQALQAAPDLRPAMRLMSTLHRERRDVRGLVEFIDAEIRATRHPKEAAALYRERGMVVEAQFGDLEAALECYRASLNASAGDIPSLRAAERLFLSRGDLPGLTQNLEQQLDSLNEGRALAPIFHELALLELHRGGNSNLASDLLKASLERSPGHLVLAMDLMRASEIIGDDVGAIQALDQSAEHLSAHGRALLMSRAAAVLRESGNKERAIPLMRAAAFEHEDSLSMWTSLRDHATAAGEYEVAVDASIRIAGLLHPEDSGARAEAFYQAGKLATRRTARVDLGVSALVRALREDPDHLPALEEAARLLFSERRYAQLLEVLEHQAQTATIRGLTRKELSLAHLRVGQVLERHLSRPEAALRAYERAVDFAPEFRPPKDAIERLLHVQSDTRGLLNFYERELESTTEPARKNFLHALSGQIATRVGENQLASKHWIALLKSQPDHMIALQSLARLVAKQGRKQDLLKITTREAALTQSPSRKAKLLHRCGELHLEAGDIDQARACLEEALDARDDFVPALEMLHDVLKRQEDHPALLESLQRRLLYAPDRHSRATVHIEISTILATELGRPEEALDILDVLLSRWPEHLPAIHMASRLAELLNDWSKLTSILDAHILATRSTHGRALLLHQNALIHAKHLGDDETACRLLTRALAFWPDLGVARAKLLQLYEKLGRSRELHSLAEAALDVERSPDAREALALQLAELTPRVEVAMQYLEPVAKARPNDLVTQQRLARAALYARKDVQESTARTRLAGIVNTAEPPDLREVHTQTYLAGCALERAKKLDEADALFTSILDEDPEFVVAVRARKRIKTLRSELASPVTQDRLDASGETSDAEAASLANIAAEIMERRGRYEDALEHLKRARAHAPDYLPALHTEARVLARQDGTAAIIRAISLEERIAEHTSSPRHKSRALVRAGRLALRRANEGTPAPEAWRLLGLALTHDPGNDDAAMWLMRTLVEHGPEGAPNITQAVAHRIERLAEESRLAAADAQLAGRLALETDGPAASIELFQLALSKGAERAELAPELANLYTQVEDWERSVQTLETMLEGAPPERSAAIHFYIGEAERARGNHPRAITSFMEAGAGGFYPLVAFSSAETLGHEHGDHAAVVAALERKLEVLPGEKRPQALRQLARIYADVLDDAPRAIEFLRRVVASEPDDLGAIRDLHKRLQSTGQTQEADATIMGAIAQHRARIRSRDFLSSTQSPPSEIVARLALLYKLSGQTDGVFLATALREVLAASTGEEDSLPFTCDDLVSVPWPLPVVLRSRGLDGLIGDVSNSTAVALLHEASFCAPPPPTARSTQKASPSGPPLPSSNSAMIVVAHIAEVLGVSVPKIYLDSNIEGVGHLASDKDTLMIGRDTHSAPSAPVNRGLFGRALFTAAVGGAHVRREIEDSQRIGYIVALMRAANVEVPEAIAAACDGADVPTFDDGDLGNVASLEDAGREVAQSFANSRESFSGESISLALDRAEDRVAILCAADPRPVIGPLLESGTLDSPRGHALLDFLFSDEHLRLRASWGYHVVHLATEGGES